MRVAPYNVRAPRQQWWRRSGSFSPTVLAQPLYLRSRTHTPRCLHVARASALRHRAVCSLSAMHPCLEWTTTRFAPRVYGALAPRGMAP